MSDRLPSIVRWDSSIRALACTTSSSLPRDSEGEPTRRRAPTLVTWLRLGSVPTGVIHSALILTVVFVIECTSSAPTPPSGIAEDPPNPARPSSHQAVPVLAPKRLRLTSRLPPAPGSRGHVQRIRFEASFAYKHCSWKRERRSCRLYDIWPKLCETSTVLNVVLHVIYGISCVYLGTPTQTVEVSLNALVKYGISLKALAAPQQPIYSLLLAHAPYNPIEAYALAARHDLEEAAVMISAHLLSYDSSQLSDELAIKMGSVYLWRLLDLHLVRTEALKRIVLRPPAMHPLTLTCDFAAQGRLTNAWAFTAAQLAWEGLPGTSTHALQSTFGKVGAGITCQSCMVTLQSRIQEVIQQWSAVKRTI